MQKILLPRLNADFNATNAQEFDTKALSELRKNLDTNFAEFFDKAEFKRHYFGNEEEIVYAEKDYATEIQTGKKPEPTTRISELHFRHEALADLFNINFATMHQHLMPCMKALAMHYRTNNENYELLAEDFFEEAIIAGNENLGKGRRITIWPNERKRIWDSLELAAHNLVNHHRPKCLRDADLIDPMSQDENPGPRHD
ncbi:MAG: hypothetical protein ACRBCT_05250 [Alphaproteobacteria bacterium]